MGSASAKEWFYLSLGNRRGPVSLDEICDKIAKHDVYIDSTKVWKEGMKDWVGLADAKPFASYIKAIRAEATKAEARVQHAAQAEGVDESVVCRGATRALFNVFFYVGWLLPVMLGVILLTESQVYQLVEPKFVRENAWVTLIPLLFWVIALWKIAGTRMNHAGYSKSYGYTIFVPLWNLWTFFICLCAPRNFGRKKKLGKGAAVSLLVFILVCATVVLGVIPGVNLKQLSPVAINEKVTDFYQDKTNFRERYNQKISQSAQVESRREQIKKKREAELDAKNRAMLDKRGIK